MALGPNVVMGLMAMGCNAAGLCVIGDDTGHLGVSINPSGGGSTWHITGSALRSVRAIACALPALCVASDPGGRVATSKNPLAGRGSWVSQRADHAAIAGLSCASDVFCVGVDSAGAVVVGRAAPRCVVPTVIGKGLAAARSAIRAARCAVGTVVTPRRPKRKPPKHTHWALVVAKQSPNAGAVRAAGFRVRLTLAYRAGRN